MTTKGADVRFGISHVLDTIEKKLSTDPGEAGAVVDLGEIIRLSDLDGGRPAHLLRLGLMVDAINRHLNDDTISVFVVAERGLLSETDLTANEKIVIRRWADDGQIELVQSGGPSSGARSREVAALTGLPLITRRTAGYPGLTYAPAANGGGATLIPQVLGPGPAAPAPVLGRQWRCPESDCASFSAAREGTQPPAQLRNGKPYCPRHGVALRDVGAWPREVSLAIRVADVSWHRFRVTEAAPVVVGRAPEEPEGVPVGLALDERGLRWVSRSHVELTLRGHRLQVTDISTNGTILLQRSGPGEEPRRTPLGNGETATFGEWDTIELFERVELGRASRAAGPAPGGPAASVLTDAPTQAIRFTD